MIYFFFNQMKTNGYCSIKEMKKEWGRLWVGKRRKADLLIPVENKLKLWHRKRERDGLDALFKLHQSFSTDKSDIVAVNMPYNVSLTKEVTLVGRWPLIKVIGEKVEILDFREREEIESKDMDIALTAMSFAFRQQFQSTENKLYLYEIGSGRLLPTTRKEKDFALLKQTVKDFVILCNTQTFIRSMSKRCDQCVYSFLCKGGT